MEEHGVAEHQLWAHIQLLAGIIAQMVGAIGAAGPTICWCGATVYPCCAAWSAVAPQHDGGRQPSPSGNQIPEAEGGGMRQQQSRCCPTPGPPGAPATESELSGEISLNPCAAEPVSQRTGPKGGLRMDRKGPRLQQQQLPQPDLSHQSCESGDGWSLCGGSKRRGASWSRWDWAEWRRDRNATVYEAGLKRKAEDERRAAAAVRIQRNARGYLARRGLATLEVPPVAEVPGEAAPEVEIPKAKGKRKRRKNTKHAEVDCDDSYLEEAMAKADSERASCLVRLEDAVAACDQTCPEGHRMVARIGTGQDICAGCGISLPDQVIIACGACGDEGREFSHCVKCEPVLLKPLLTAYEAGSAGGSDGVRVGEHAGRDAGGTPGHEIAVDAAVSQATGSTAVSQLRGRDRIGSGSASGAEDSGGRSSSSSGHKSPNPG